MVFAFAKTNVTTASFTFPCMHSSVKLVASCYISDIGETGVGWDSFHFLRCQLHMVELSHPTPSRSMLGQYTGYIGIVLNVCVLRAHSQ